MASPFEIKAEGRSEGRERQKEKEEARRPIGEPACAPYDQAPTSEYFFILPSDFIVRCLTFADFVNFCSS